MAAATAKTDYLLKRTAVTQRRRFVTARHLRCLLPGRISHLGEAFSLVLSELVCFHHPQEPTFQKITKKILFFRFWLGGAAPPDPPGISWGGKAPLNDRT